MKRLLVLALTVVTTLGLAGCTGDPYEGVEDYTHVEGRETIKIGLECDYQPFNWAIPKVTGHSLPIQNNKLYADGYDVQIAKYLSKELDVNVELYMTSWNNLIIGVKNNTIDLIIAGMSPTEERKKEINFTDAYYTSDFVIVVHEDNKKIDYTTAKSFEDLRGTIGVGQNDTLYENLVKNLADGVYGDLGITQKLSTGSVPEIALGLRSTYDFTIVEKPVAEGLVATNSQLKIVELEGENPFNVSDDDRICSIGVSKSDEKDLVNRINVALSKLSADERTKIMADAVKRA